MFSADLTLFYINWHCFSKLVIVFVGIYHDLANKGYSSFLSGTTPPFFFLFMVFMVLVASFPSEGGGVTFINIWKAVKLDRAFQSSDSFALVL